MEWSFTIKSCDQDISWSRKFVGLNIKKSVLTAKMRVLTIKIGVWPWNWNLFWPWKLLTILSALECQSRTWTWHFGAGSLGSEVALFPGYTVWERGLNPLLSVEICCLNWNLSPQLKFIASTKSCCLKTKTAWQNGCHETARQLSSFCWLKLTQTAPPYWATNAI